MSLRDRLREKSANTNPAGHADDWLMTYADMITLLLCFFAILLAVSVPQAEKFKEAREQMMRKFATANIEEGRFPVQKNNEAGGLPNKALDNLPSIVDKYPDMPSIVDKGATEQQNQEAQPKTPPPQKGDRITTVEMPSAAFFPSGSATLSDDGKKILSQVLTNLNTAQYKDFIITVEGHTDDNPIKTALFPSNWELSTARAAAVVRYFIEQGMPASKLRASGYADVMPKVPNRDTAGNPIPANQAQNRRVVIKLEKIDKQATEPPAQ